MPQSPKVDLKVVQKSAFPSKVHFNQGTAKVGSLVPVLVDELIPNTTVDIKMAVAASLPPLAADAFMNVDYCVEAFFVPMRLCYQGFESFFTQTKMNQVYGNASHVPQIDSSDRAVLPRLFVRVDVDPDEGFSDMSILKQPHNLFDYFSAFYDQESHYDEDTYLPINPMLYVAYNLIWDNWYRNTLVQKSAFASIAGWNNSLQPSECPFMTLPSSVYTATHGNIYLNALTLYRLNIGQTPSQFSYLWRGCFADGHPFFKLRQRNFGFDYFTNSWPSAQHGDSQSVTIADGKFSISALRGANSLQQWEEQGQFCPRLVEAVRARYGAHLSDSIAQRPICLGSGRYPIVSKSVDVTATNTGNVNPMAGSAGAQVARGYANGTEHLIDSFTAQEPGYLFILGSLVPSVTYSSGVDRLNSRYMLGSFAGQRVEMADPLLQNTGNQPIYRFELGGDIVGDSSGIFGYSDRFADFMVKRNSVHGLLRLTSSNYLSNSLNMFVAQRFFGGAGSGSSLMQSSAFLQIPTNYLDNVTAVRESVSTYGYWYECGFNYRCSMPLAQYSVPSLQNPAYEHGQTVTVHRGGFRF